MYYNKIEKEAAIRGINCFIFYSWNYPSEPVSVNTTNGTRIIMVPSVIAKVKWSCGVQHMVKKWLEAADGGDTNSYFIRFYAELSPDNRRALLEWIIENYNSGRTI